MLVFSELIYKHLPPLPQSQYIFLHDALKELIVCGETEIPAHALMTTVNQLKEPAAVDEEIDMAQSWLEQDTPTGFQRQFNVSDSIHCLCPNVPYPGH